MQIETIVIGRHVELALKKRRPVVALESSVIAQGLPAPYNLEAALRCEEVIREEGATPATIAAVNGQFIVGIEREHFELLSSGSSSLVKISSRDLTAVHVRHLTGGTTVSASVELAARVGIRVFSTGGIGGVHRGASGDVSQDMWAISKFPVAVICAGAKSILDLERTLEMLETMCVPVVGIGTNEFPGFYCEKTGFKLEHRATDAVEAADFAHARFENFKQGGLVLALPPPRSSSLPNAFVERLLKIALKKALAKEIKGKSLTPFLLSEMTKATRGKSLSANLSLLENNARFAAQVAHHYSKKRIPKLRSSI